MKTIAIIIIFFLALYVLSYITDENFYERKQQLKSRKMLDKINRKHGVINKHRAHIICNNIIMVKTFAGNDYSDILNKSIDYSLKEADDFQDVILIKKDVIYS
jgi:hypothetical protein